MGNSYQGVKQRARANRDAKLDQHMKLINESSSKLDIRPEKNIKIVSLNVHEAVELLNKGELTSEQLLDALAQRCSTVGKELNVFTCTNFEWALNAAKACDLHRKESGKRNWTPEDGDFNDEKFLPALYGIPISVKDIFHVDGLVTTIGMYCKAQNKEPQSELVKCFKNSGMIPFIKTNIPQFGMTVQTNNNLWGRTRSPWNPERSVGGSSGGEGAIISARCSMLGVGSDIGGSVRTPADHCGIYGLKPYSKRISNQYHAVYSSAFTSFGKAIALCIGPLARSSKDLALFMDIATNQKYYNGGEDPFTKIVPFDWKVYQETEKGAKKYKIGYIKSLKDIQPSHASRRAIDQVIELLKKDGHQLVEVQIPEQRDVIRAFVGQYGSCKMEKYYQMLQGQKPINQYKTLFQLMTMWPVTRFLISWPLKKLQPRPHFYFIEKKPFGSVMEYQHHLGYINELKNKWVTYWKQNKLDFVICPGFGTQALPHGKSQQIGLAASYMFIWNVLDMVAGSLPVTVVKDNEIRYESAINDMVTGELRQIAQQSLGLPVGIQVIGLPYHEERVLGLMSNLEKKIQFYRKHPLPNI